ncbi:hypothetical protein LK03_16985 [Pseudomonas cremoricolorata]|uniref:Uncharacterized protein n=1 Tax=Pseudomonas cremoricolorata TaxID=157783 RepID=A0A089WUF6_9PSED|nr:hypothetical protein LK03_16985 [Pseudomonas cremoricolorata]
MPEQQTLQGDAQLRAGQALQLTGRQPGQRRQGGRCRCGGGVGEQGVEGALQAPVERRRWDLPQALEQGLGRVRWR